MTNRVSEQTACIHPMVSVVMVTYNHEKFIEQAIKSVLMQETDFPIELIIGEDCSTDGTRKIVKEYASKYPKVIRLRLPGKNLGAKINFIEAIEACTGNFIACLEGDDYWTDSQKLSRQVSFLNTHPECMSCFHNVIVFSDDPHVPVEGYHAQADGRQLMCAPDLKTRFSQNDFLKRNYIPTCSVMFRRASAGKLPDWYKKLSVGDWPLHILCTEQGTSEYMPEVMGAYRLHRSNAWSGKTQLYRISQTLEMFEALEGHFQGRPQQAVLREERMDMLQGYARLLNREGQPREAGAAAGSYLKLALEHPSFCLKHLSSLRRMFVLFCSVKLGRPAKS